MYSLTSHDLSPPCAAGSLLLPNLRFFLPLRRNIHLLFSLHPHISTIQAAHAPYYSLFQLQTLHQIRNIGCMLGNLSPCTLRRYMCVEALAQLITPEYSTGADSERTSSTISGVSSMSSPGLPASSMTVSSSHWILSVRRLSSNRSARREYTVDIRSDRLEQVVHAYLYSNSKGSIVPASQFKATVTTTGIHPGRRPGTRQRLCRLP